MSKKKKKNPAGKQQPPLKPTELLRKKARSYPIHECRLLTKQLSLSGISQVIVTRMKPNGNLIVGVYLVDIWCLGLKNTFYRHDYTLEEYGEMIDALNNQEAEGALEICEPDFAFNLIYGAIEYAEDIGFQPHKDFALTEYILPDVDDVEFMEMEFGRDGKPSYFSGPYDKVQGILAKLDKNVGPGNYEFVAGAPGNFSDGFFDDDDEYDDDDDEYDDDDNDDDEEEYTDYEEVK